MQQLPKSDEDTPGMVNTTETSGKQSVDPAVRPGLEPDTGTIIMYVGCGGCCKV